MLPRSVESITLDMGISYWRESLEDSKLDPDNVWWSVDHLLSGSQFPVLKELNIWSEHMKVAEQGVKRMWPKLLPLCAAKQILAVNVTSPTGRPSPI
jgi:hypothetical protein